jgi:peptide/nickel transport system permease protein
MSFLSHLFARVLPRTLVLLGGTIIGTIALMQWAPGYYSDVRELDSQTGSSVRQALEQERSKNRGELRSAVDWVRSALGGDLGESRQFEIPVSALLAERGVFSLRLLLTALAGGWSAACIVACLLTLVKRKGLHALCLIPAACLLALPVGALSMICFVTDTGGPVLVMALLIGARELQFIQRLLNNTLQEPHFLYLQAAGVRRSRILWAFALPQLLSQSLALLLRSFLMAIGLLIPVEVIFDLPGLGQLAWLAMMNRDLPVLLAVTMLFAGCLAVFGTMADFRMEPERA